MGKKCWEGSGGDGDAIRQSLLGRALPTLGAIGDVRPIDNLTHILSSEPALTPQVAAYLTGFAAGGPSMRTKVRRALDDITTSDVLSPWQQMWIADVAGGVRRAREEHKYESWLHDCARGTHPGLAATASAALGRLGRGDADLVAQSVDRVPVEWRTLAFWGLIGVDPDLAGDVSDGMLERQLLDAAAAQ